MYNQLFYPFLYYPPYEVYRIPDCVQNQIYSQNLISVQNSQPMQMVNIFEDLFKQKLIQKHKQPTVRVWTSQQDRILLEKTDEGMNLKQICQLLCQKNISICRRRLNKLKKKQKLWPKTIEIQIKRLYEVQILNWEEIHKIYPNYSVKQLREHYRDFLQIQIRKEEWTIEEDWLLWSEVEQHGKKWKKISKKFEGRTENQLKNRYFKSLIPIYRSVVKKVDYESGLPTQN